MWTTLVNTKEDANTPGMVIPILGNVELSRRRGRNELMGTSKKTLVTLAPWWLVRVGQEEDTMRMTATSRNSTWVGSAVQNEKAEATKAKANTTVNEEGTEEKVKGRNTVEKAKRHFETPRAERKVLCTERILPSLMPMVSSLLHLGIRLIVRK